MSERKMHYFELHFQKLLAATKGWKDDEVGAFVKLLIEQFDRGYVPDDPAEIDRLITSRKKNWKLLVRKFTAPSQPGQLRNAFMITVRNEAHEKSNKNAASGAKGGRAKKSNAIANAIANGKANATKTLQRNGSQPVTSNQEPVTSIVTPEEDKSVNGEFTRPDLSGSNLFRKAVIPTWEEVYRVFLQQGGTEVMAKRFFDSNTATGWFHKGSPITNFSNLVPGYVSNWNEREGIQTAGSPKKMVL